MWCAKESPRNHQPGFQWLGTRSTLYGSPGATASGRERTKAGATSRYSPPPKFGAPAACFAPASRVSATAVPRSWSVTRSPVGVTAHSWRQITWPEMAWRVLGRVRFSTDRWFARAKTYISTFSSSPRSRSELFSSLILLVVWLPAGASIVTCNFRRGGELGDDLGIEGRPFTGRDHAGPL